MEYELDTGDASVAALFAFAIFSVVDITNVNFMGATFQDELTTLLNGDVVLSIGGGIALIIWGFVYFTNDNDIQLDKGMDDNYTILVIASTLITAGLVFVDPVQAWFMAQHDVITALGPLISFAGLLSIGYLK